MCGHAGNQNGFLAVSREPLATTERNKEIKPAGIGNSAAFKREIAPPPFTASHDHARLGPAPLVRCARACARCVGQPLGPSTSGHFDDRLPHERGQSGLGHD